MRTITRLNSKLHGDYGNRKTRKYRVIKEYPRYYLCECVEDDKCLFKECFLKIDIDRIIPVELEKESNPRVGWHM